METGTERAADGRRTEARAHPVEVADTVGAGDAFMSALLHARHTGAPLATALTHATTAATLTVTRPGATPPDAAELTAALDGDSGGFGIVRTVKTSADSGLTH
ncbi:hypothetical protein GCM10009639_13610 [Kitasatospora putterlickiae]|uniref:Carbohydrate kinase PfkB domain-containing protein n=1 Tax=Kitasatospora putterlickiae TaxID=221725 RepID=A0ABN1XR35_9ACTN